MTDVGRQPGDRTLEVIATFGVAPRVNVPQFVFGCFTPTADRAELPFRPWELLRQQGVECIAGRELPRQVAVDRG